MTANEAAAMDPQHRILLEETLAALLEANALFNIPINNHAGIAIFPTLIKRDLFKQDDCCELVKDLPKKSQKEILLELIS